ncbi:MAG: EAL domain-containing protein [Candidatus Eremiobacteraeota bacterium]|nr:EAL domain-containing protein [Candidatus Eremiobacteraeota bacterium]
MRIDVERPEPRSESTGELGRLVRAERRLAIFEALVLGTGVPMAITAETPEDPEIIYVNESFADAFGYEPAEIVGHSSSIVHAKDYAPETRALVVAARRRCVAVTVEFSGVRKNGERVWCETTISPVISDEGNCEAFVEIVRDITARRSADRLMQDRGEVLELIASDAPLTSVFAAIVASSERSTAGVASAIMLRRGDFLHVDACGASFRKAFAGSLPVVAIDIAGNPCAAAAVRGEQVVQTARETPLDPYSEVLLRSRLHTSISTPIRRSNGEVVGTFAQHFSDAAPIDADRRVGYELAHLVGIATERRSDRERLEFLAHHDPLTGLPNRLSFEGRVVRAIAHAKLQGRRIAVAMCDLDRFKVVNDSLGQAVGDRLLREVGGRLGRAMRAEDTLARLSGDKFAVLMEVLGDREEAVVAGRRMLDMLAPSFNGSGQEVFLRGCMGIGFYPDDGDEPEALLAACESALAAARTRGQTVALHEADATTERRGASRIALESSLQYALERDQLYVLFQPLVDLDGYEMRGVEALLRWRHPEHGEVLPDAFIHAAEDTGLIVPIGAWVLEEACRLARRWQDDGCDRFVSVNVSARQFERRDFIGTIVGVLARTGLEPQRLHLELTESLVMRSPELAAAALADLKRLGVKISVDDFGTGYSSFDYLKRFPLDALKIDRLFVRDIGSDGDRSNDEAIVRAIAGVARALDLSIVAEGVETEKQAAFLRAIGVPLAQGWLFARALPPDEAYRWRWSGPA